MKPGCRHLSKKFGNGLEATRALEDISYEMRGYFFLLFGPAVAANRGEKDNCSPVFYFPRAIP